MISPFGFFFVFSFPAPPTCGTDLPPRGLQNISLRANRFDFNALRLRRIYSTPPFWPPPVSFPHPPELPFCGTVLSCLCLTIIRVDVFFTRPFTDSGAPPAYTFTTGSSFLHRSARVPPLRLTTQTESPWLVPTEPVPLCRFLTDVPHNESSLCSFVEPVYILYLPDFLFR